MDSVWNFMDFDVFSFFVKLQVLHLKFSKILGHFFTSHFTFLVPRFFADKNGTRNCNGIKSKSNLNLKKY